MSKQKASAMLADRNKNNYLKKSVMKKQFVFFWLLFVSTMMLSAQENQNVQSTDDEGYRGIVELGKARDINIQIINSYRVDLFSIGVGTGIYAGDDGTGIPLFLDLRGAFSTRTVSPYFSCGIGCVFNIGNGETHFLFNPNIGILFSQVVSIGIGYEFQTYREKELGPFGIVREKDISMVGNMAFRVGFWF